MPQPFGVNLSCKYLLIPSLIWLSSFVVFAAAAITLTISVNPFFCFLFIAAILASTLLADQYRLKHMVIYGPLSEPFLETDSSVRLNQTSPVNTQARVLTQGVSSEPCLCPRSYSLPRRSFSSPKLSPSERCLRASGLPPFCFERDSGSPEVKTRSRNASPTFNNAIVYSVFGDGLPTCPGPLFLRSGRALFVYKTCSARGQRITLAFPEFGHKDNAKMPITRQDSEHALDDGFTSGDNQGPPRTQESSEALEDSSKTTHENYDSHLPRTSKTSLESTKQVTGGLVDTNSPDTFNLSAKATTPPGPVSPVLHRAPSRQPSPNMTMNSGCPSAGDTDASADLKQWQPENNDYASCSSLCPDVLGTRQDKENVWRSMSWSPISLSTSNDASEASIASSGRHQRTLVEVPEWVIVEVGNLDGGAESASNDSLRTRPGAVTPSGVSLGAQSAKDEGGLVATACSMSLHDVESQKATGAPKKAKKLKLIPRFLKWKKKEKRQKRAI